jgi:signal transduction histidine kinase
LVIALPVAGLVATFFLRLPVTEQQQQTAAILARSSSVRSAAQDLLVTLLDAETGARGYALSGDKSFLDGYNVAIARVPQALDYLKGLVLPGEETVLYEQIVARAFRRVELAREVVALGAQNAAAPALREKVSEARHEMDACRTAVDTLLDAQQRQVEQSQAELARIRQQTTPIVGITFLSGFIGAGAAMWLFVTGISRRASAVERNAERLARGERLRWEPSRGFDEIGRLDSALRRAAILIRARDRELRQLNATLEHSLNEQRLLNRELEAFSYSVSHDLRAPLRSIDGFAQALREDWGDRLDEAGQDHLARVRNAAQRMGRLIDDLLKLSRLSRAQIQRVEVDLSQIARDIAAEMQERNPTRQVEWLIDDSLTERCDPSLARIVLENLLGNAWKFTSKTADARIEFTAMRDTVPVTYVVRDNGAGFDMKYADKLFAPFQRLHGEREFPGTGIGLATVQRIVHKHSGEVSTRAEVGRGAAFYFTLDSRDGVAAA